ncbi:MAG TPA: UDP-glucose 4-epimerase GalE [Pyrinomonadaceae bacterium]|jgi:UDP-glucose 4-epimerase|nr:UDP-glucose 4-epimerase GalE [Pyrinomonadaceae bacterium]
MKILVTGGAGYIGSVVTEELLNDGHEAIVYDSLIKGHRAAVDARAQFIEADLTDGEMLRRALRHNQIEAVIHMAAHSLVGESVEHPDKYFHNNLGGGLKLIDAMRDSGVKKLVFSSTAATYGEPEKQPIEESDPTRPTNPYGESKLAFEKALHWYEKAYGLRYASLRYFNAAGASKQFGEEHDPETHLIPLVLQAANGTRADVQIFGDDYPTRDGTCVRDYIHVIDLARAHILALNILDDRSAIYNLGCGGDGYTVKELIDVAREVTHRDISARTAKRRAGDPAVLIASSDKIKQELGWSPKFQDLKLIIQSAWDWMQEHPQGYGSEPPA